MKPRENVIILISNNLISKSTGIYFCQMVCRLCRLFKKFKYMKGSFLYVYDLKLGGYLKKIELGNHNHNTYDS